MNETRLCPKCGKKKRMAQGQKLCTFCVMSYNGRHEHWRKPNNDFIGRPNYPVDRDDFGVPLDYDDAEKPLTEVFNEFKNG